jgi:quercetin dioxygenase-like cupin family protein
MKEAVPTIHIDNEHVRVTEWRFEPGATTGWHRHAYDYTVTPVTAATVEAVGPDGKSSVFDMVPGRAYFREAGVEHEVINRGPGELRFVETELKHRAG